MNIDWVIVLTTFGAAFVQGVSGFGFALVAMPLLLGSMTIATVVPLTALLTLTNNIVMSLYYRRACDRPLVIKLLLASALGIPIGFVALERVPAVWMLMGLGLMITAYASYALASPRMPKLKSDAWLYGAGWLSGMLMGSYNLPGPPVVLYASSQQWSPEKFKGNITLFFS